MNFQPTSLVATIATMAKRKDGGGEKHPKNQPISLRIDEPTANQLEDIRLALAKMATVPVTITALVETAIKEFIQSRRDLLNKGRPKPK